MKTIDLRSDTVTKPSPEMRTAMANAEVDDDVIDVDPTVAKLQSTIAELLGMEAAMFMPSGTMTNQTAIRLHCNPGDNFLCDAGCHIFNYEQGAYAQLSGVVAHPVVPANDDRIIRVDDFRNLINPDNEHMTRTRLVCLENTLNRGGGRVIPIETIAEISKWARENNLIMHLDGARLFNAVVATGIPAFEWAKYFDTVSVCFSKGLGAPVGSALCGKTQYMEKLRRHRKLFGGGMRQAGIIAAGALYALENNIQRLEADHRHAMLLADGIEKNPNFHLDPAPVETNIVIFKVDPESGNSADVVKQLESVGIRSLPFSRQHVRLVTHMHISSEDAQHASQILASLEVAASPV
jgi:threonine aldolase